MPLLYWPAIAGAAGFAVLLVGTASSTKPAVDDQIALRELTGKDAGTTAEAWRK